MALTLIAFLFVLGLIVLVHEFGHYFTARKFGIKIDEFGLGIPPRIFGIYKENNKWKFVGRKNPDKIEKTIWSINWIPLGGFVKIKGEAGEDAADPDSFAAKPVWQRAIVLSAGVFMNVILAILLLGILFTIGTPQVISESALPNSAQVRDREVLIVNILENSPAERSELESGDRIISVEGTVVASVTDLQNLISQQSGEELNITIARDGQELQKNVVPETISLPESAGGGERLAIGVDLVEVGFVSYPWYTAWWYGIVETGKMIIAVVYGFYMVIKGLLVQGNLVGEVYGPVGIAGLIGDAARMGIVYLLQFTAVLSVIIAVVNFLPFPALDGGRVLFVAIEAIRGKPVNPKFEAFMHNLGFALLMLLVLLVTFKDIARISGSFSSFGQKIISFF